MYVHPEAISGNQLVACLRIAECQRKCINIYPGIQLTFSCEEVKRERASRPPKHSPLSSLLSPPIRARQTRRDSEALRRLRDLDQLLRCCERFWCELCLLDLERDRRRSDRRQRDLLLLRVLLLVRDLLQLWEPRFDRRRSRDFLRVLDLFQRRDGLRLADSLSERFEAERLRD